MNFSQFVVTGGSQKKTSTSKIQYDAPVLVIGALPTKPRVSSDMEFNESAANLLNITPGEQVVFLTHMYQDGRLFIANAGKTDEKLWNLKLNKNDYSIGGSTRKTHEILTEKLNYAILNPTTPIEDGDGELNEGKEVVLELVEVTDVQLPANTFELVTYVPKSDEPSDEEQKADSQEEEYVEQETSAEVDASVNQW